MAEKVFSEELKRQTQLAWDYLEKAKPLITYMKLVPIDEKQIVEYEKGSGKVVPPDLRYWLTTYGSGRIEFLQGELQIASVYEWMEDPTRLVGVTPEDQARRISVDCHWYVSDPLLSTEAGCTPILTGDPLEKSCYRVVSSSWPLYVVKNILDIGKELKVKSNYDFSTAQLEVINALSELWFETIDTCLDEAIKRHTTQPPKGLLKKIGDKFKLFDSSGELKSPQFPKAGRLVKKVYSEDAIEQALADIEYQISAGYSELKKDCDAEKVGEEHIGLLKKVADHERREVPEVFLELLINLCPGEAEKFLSKEKSYNDSRKWERLVKTWIRLNDKNEAIRCLKIAEIGIDHRHNWEWIFDLWMNELNDKDGAYTCLDNVEQEVANLDGGEVDNLVALADAWFDLGRPDRSWVCIVRYLDIEESFFKKKKNNFEFWVWFEGMMTLLVDKHKDLGAAKEAIKKARRLAGHSFENSLIDKTVEKYSLGP